MATVGTTTPEQAASPKKHALAITEAQKQALIDNLQLEVTERARKLRAQYALQAQGLRTRLEMRINRIPQGLRKMKMQDLVEKHQQQQQQQQQHKPAPVSASALPVKHNHHIASQIASPAKRGLKRPSDDFPIASDKENAEPATQGNTDIPKKRSKPNPPPTATITAIPSSPATVRKTRPAVTIPTSTIKHTSAVPSTQTTILSPKSHNSRALQALNRSPVKSPPPTALRSPYPRPATATSTHPRATATRPASRLGGPPKQRPGTALGLSPERPPTRTRKVRTSTDSDSSAQTTIVRSKNTTTTTNTNSTTQNAATAGKAAVAKSKPTVKEVAAPAPAPAPAPVKETKRTGIKNALSSLTGSKRGKAALAAAAAAATPSAPAATTAGGRVLRKRG